MFIVAMLTQAYCLDLQLMCNLPIPLFSIHGIKFNNNNNFAYEGGAFVNLYLLLNIDNLYFKLNGHIDLNLPLESVNKPSAHIGHEIGYDTYYILGNSYVRAIPSCGVTYAYHEGNEDDNKYCYNKIQYYMEPFIDFKFKYTSLSIGLGLAYFDNTAITGSIYYGTVFMKNKEYNFEFSCETDLIYNNNFYDFKFGLYLGWSF